MRHPLIALCVLVATSLLLAQSTKPKPPKAQAMADRRGWQKVKNKYVWISGALIELPEVDFSQPSNRGNGDDRITYKGIGSFGRPEFGFGGKVQQVLGDDSMRVSAEMEAGASGDCVVCGFDTKNISDGDRWSTKEPIAIVGPISYSTIEGIGRRVRVIIPLSVARQGLTFEQYQRLSEEGKIP